MTDPVNVALKVVDGIVDHAARAVANTEDCKLLAALAEQTKPFLQALEQHPVDDPSLQTALDLVFSALDEADCVIETCCKSTYLTAMFCARKNSEMLKHAAQKLEHALQQVPLTNLPVTGEIHECMNALADELRRAKFDSVAASTHQARILKEEMENAFNKNLKGTEEMKSIIVDMMTEHSKTVEARLQDLLVLKDYIREARRDKDTQQEFELQQIIDVISESIQQKETAPSSHPGDAVLADQLRCPISTEIMKDPVVLKDSGVTYDRDSIVKWLERGHREDPITKTEIRSGDLIPNRLVESILNSAFDVEESADRLTEQKEEQPLEAGLYEGYGQQKQEDGTVESVYLLVCLHPDGNVQGCRINEVKDKDTEQQSLILEGKWEAFNPNLSFTDEQFDYEGTLHAAPCFQRAFRFVGKTTPLKDSFSSGSFEYPQLTPPPLQYHFLLRSGLLEMEGTVFGANGQEYRSKALLSLKKDSDLRGWLSIEESPGSIRVGHVLSNDWKLNGRMSLSLYFPKSANEPLGSPSSPSNFLARYKLEGNLSVGDTAGHRQGAIYEGSWKVEKRGEDTASDAAYPKMISGLESFGRYKYDCFRAPSRRLSTLLQNHIRPLRLTNDPGEHTQFSRFVCCIAMSQIVSSIPG